MNQEQRSESIKIEDEITAQCDERLLQVVMENLLSNAWKFTSREQKAVIEFGRVTVNGIQTHFVRDNGVGFDMSQAENLFLPFQRLHGSSEFEGNGIGLATVARIIERHEGIIWAEAEVGKGATFYFTLGTG